ncbi:MAG: response regulator transcription factor [Saprospirales bacterium]|nr:response regulator transcription factor [Saprospirales bacterium]
MDFKIILVDDEAACRHTLRRFLEMQGPDVRVLGEAQSVAEGAQLLREMSPDLLLLDVQMEDGTGFDLLDRFPNLTCNVVFTTAHDDFAIRAFRYNAIDYLLKPVDPDELATAIRKAREHQDLKTFQGQIAQLVQTATDKNFDRITLPTSAGPVFALTKDITRMETYGNYTFVYLADGERHLVSRNLKEFEEMLLQPNFFRLHQSHLVNTACVKKFLKEDGGYALMQDGTKVPVSRRRKEAFLELLKG